WLANHPDLDAIREIAILQACALVTPRLTHFDRPELAAPLDLQYPMRVAKADFLDDAGELDVFAGRPGPSVMAERRTVRKYETQYNCCGENLLHDRSPEERRVRL